MSVDDRLRLGLARNAATVDPSTERVLSSILHQSRRRRRRRWTAIAATAFALLVLAVVIGSGLPLDEGDHQRRVVPVERPHRTKFPTGTYTVLANRAEALAKGFNNRQINNAYGADGELFLTLTFRAEDHHWIQAGEFTPGITEVGDRGSYRIDQEGHLVLTSTSPGCPGCVGVLRWDFDGQKLTLAFIEPDKHPAEERLITEHTYQKTG